MRLLFSICVLAIMVSGFAIAQTEGSPPVKAPANLPAEITPQAPVAALPPSISIPAPLETRHTVGTPNGKLTAAQQQRVAQRVPRVKQQIADLSLEEQRAVLRKAAPPRQKLTDEDRAARGKALRDAWSAKTPQQKTEQRQKFLAVWQKLSSEDRAYRRARMTEQLQALPEADRKAVIAPFVTSNLSSQ